MEEPERCLLRFTPLTKAGRERFSWAHIELDRSVYLPRRYLLTGPDGKATKVLLFAAGKENEPVPDYVWRLPDDTGWQVIRKAKRDDF
jgi:hypothetical protein